MPELRVLIVDSSVTVRKRIRDAIQRDSRLNLVGVAANASIAMQKLTQDRPDLVCVDIDMQDCDGLKLIKDMLDLLSNLRIVVFSEKAKKGVSFTMEALSAGAHAYVTKPNCGSATNSEWDCVEKELIPKIARFCESGTETLKTLSPQRTHPIAKIGFSAQTSVSNLNREAVSTLQRETIGIGTQIRTAIADRPKRDYKKAKGPMSLVCIGSSTGGPNALAAVFENFEENFPLPIVITQHMPPMFTEMLATRLNQFNKVAFCEAKHGDKLKAGHAYIAPGGKHMTVHRDGSGMWVELNEEPPENSCRPAVDVMMRSVAKNVGGNVLSVILTGMGKDGYVGCEYLKELGGTVFAQDEETSVVWGMPGYVTEGGLADEVLPLGDVASAIIRHVMGKAVAGRN